MNNQHDVIGLAKHDLDTPALLVDLDILERNIARMTRVFREAGVNWRPHTKGQKAPVLAHKLLAAGAIGVTCAKLGEAEVMAAAGVDNILIANQIVGAPKVARLVALAARANVIVAVDSEANLNELDRAARERGIRLAAVVEVNTGMNRSGVAPGEAPLPSRARCTPPRACASPASWAGRATRQRFPTPKRSVRRSSAPWGC